MSRTFRLRHLPALRAKKFIDAKSHNLAERRRDEIDKIVYRIYPALAVEKYSRTYFKMWNYWWSIKDMVDENLTSPVLPMICHPWVSWARISRCKTWYKRNGNQRVRAHNRNMLKHEDYDGEFFGKLHGWDIWSVD